MNVLGIGGSVHDFSCCLVTDGEIVCAIEEERLSRIKYHPLGRVTHDQFKLRCIDYCLDTAGLRIDDIDHVFANDLILPLALRNLPNPVLMNHHETHAAAVYYLSEFDEAAVLVMDGFGSIFGEEAEVVSYFAADGTELDLIKKHAGQITKNNPGLPFSWSNLDMVCNSVGVLYSFVTEELGFGLYEEGKTMGLAAYGSSSLRNIFASVVEIGPCGEIQFGENERTELGEIIRSLLKSARGDEGLFQAKADVAQGVQWVLEESVLRHAAEIKRLSGSDVLCVSGGVFMNCAANYRLLTESGFGKVFIHGASGDNGTSLGAGMHGYHQKSEAPRVVRPERFIYGGRRYDSREVDEALLGYSNDVEVLYVDEIAKETARLLASGKVIGWYQDGSEFGARALGNRSILCDPRDAHAKEHINSLIKGREHFRPFAPSVLWECQSSYFDISGPSHYMSANAYALESRDQIPAVIHVDNSARFQTVDERSNPKFYELICEFRKLTGVGVLLNTSFNENEPIVETPEEALDCFVRTDLDNLILGHYLVTKRVTPQYVGAHANS